jgi:hypothetical protein
MIQVTSYTFKADAEEQRHTKILADVQELAQNITSKSIIFLLLSYQLRKNLIHSNHRKH